MHLLTVLTRGALLFSIKFEQPHRVMKFESSAGSFEPWFLGSNMQLPGGRGGGDGSDGGERASPKVESSSSTYKGAKVDFVNPENRDSCKVSKLGVGAS